VVGRRPPREFRRNGTKTSANVTNGRALITRVVNINGRINITRANQYRKFPLKYYQIIVRVIDA